MGFILAAAGSAVGVGNLWKFPYITWENNGGAFVLIYLICVPLIGLPIMVTELMLGRKTQASTVPAMEQLGSTARGGMRWKLVGWLGVIGSATILSYVSVIAGWAVASFFDCVNWSVQGYTPPAADAFGNFLQNTGQQFWLSFSFSVVTAFIVFRGIANGIERANKILMPALFAILLLLVINSFTLRGFSYAMDFLFLPRFSELSDQAVLEALGQSFFSLSLGMGIMITYGSYMKPSQSIPKAALTVVSMDTLVAVLACVILYPIIFTFPELRSNVSASTTGMLFTTLPTLFYTKLPGGVLLGPIFYVLVTFAALSSTISLLEVTVALLIDRFSFSRARATLISAASIFLITLLVIFSLNPNNALSRFQLFGSAQSGFLYQMNQIFFRGKTGFMNIADHLVANWLLATCALFTLIFAGWFLDRKTSMAELGFATEDQRSRICFAGFRFLIRIAAPLSILYILYSVLSGADFS
jgi:NSS family neurotransmitter:Na+ symporter